MQKALNILFLFTLLVFGGCADSPGPDLPEEPDGQTRFSLSLRVPRAGVSTRAGEDPGSEDECKISQAADETYNLRILAFNAGEDPTEKTFFTELRIVSLTSRTEGSDIVYEVNASASGMEKGMKFHFVALANWPGFPECQVGGTTIDDICNDVALLFGATDFTDKQIGTDFYMPMYGAEKVQIALDRQGNYAGDDIIFYMLRALAKIEVFVKDESNYNLESVKLFNWNNKAYCAPSNAYQREHYFPANNDKGWATDLHIPVNSLVEGPVNFLITEYVPFPASNPIAIKDRNRFVTYVPEIRNLSQTEATKRPYLQLKFTGLDKDYNVAFQNYYEDGGQEVAGLYDIHRNWWYRIYVSKAGPLNIQVDMEPYREVKLEPQWGFDRDEDGNILIKFQSGPFTVYNMKDGNGNYIIFPQETENKVYLTFDAEGNISFKNNGKDLEVQDDGTTLYIEVDGVRLYIGPKPAPKPGNGSE